MLLPSLPTSNFQFSVWSVLGSGSLVLSVCCVCVEEAAVGIESGKMSLQAYSSVLHGQKKFKIPLFVVNSRDCSVSYTSVCCTYLGWGESQAVRVGR